VRLEDNIKVDIKEIEREDVEGVPFKTQPKEQI
jgi:hypothetical protein